jgi:hypothetical protein
MNDFYDDLAPFFHLIFQDWDASIRRRGEQLSRILQLGAASAGRP